ncbi:MAG: four-carbon acid sugar kinase family protein [Cyanobacteria bacterium RI_101]|nr:four-carbon acid sugar kinase family protein [Cyanobacteria bacterium RI_101]
MAASPKIIVLDDDPTGSQTVHSCPLLMKWDLETLKLGLRDPAPIFFILTNTRALPPESAGAVVKEVCRNLKAALAAEEITDFLVVSRSDSTLRGHYPLETDVIAEELGPFDAHFLIPAFFEGGRVTKESVHYLLVDGTPTPVHETEFAKDSVFGYRHSYLPDYVEEKTRGRIPAPEVERFLLPDLRQGSLERLLGLKNNVCGVVDGETQADLDRFAQDLLTATARGKRFLLRSAASILTSLANLGPQPQAPETLGRLKTQTGPGVVLVGSHVRKTTEQLEVLLQEPGVYPLEISAERLRDNPASAPEIQAETLRAVGEAFAQGKTPVIYTSRGELNFDSIQARLDFGQELSALLMAIVQNLPPEMGYLISKGGITSNDVLSAGLGLRSARLLGQVLPGVSAVQTGADHPRFPRLPVVLFPGNVGDAQALAEVYRRFR